LLKETVANLTDMVGGKPSAAQKILIDTCALMTVRLSLVSKQLARGEGLTEGCDRHSLAWSNSLSRALRALGLHDRAESPMTLTEYLKGRQTPSEGHR
jgi:hypothetical protein